MTRVVAIAANSAWNIRHFRSSLIRSIEREGYTPVVLSPLSGAPEPKPATEEFEWLDVPVDRAGLNPMADFRLFLAYRRLLRRVRAKTFLGFTIKPNIYGCLAARSLGIPSIANISGLGTSFMRTGPLNCLVRMMYRVALARACVVFFQNPDDLDLFVADGLVRKGQARLIPGSGIELDHFTPVALARDHVKFLLIARLLGDKGVREFAEAAQLIRIEFPDARFQILGALDPANRSSIDGDELRAWVALGSVEHLGEASDVRTCIAKATAIVLPSYREGLPRTLLEGAAMARPLIATDVPGCREVIDEGVNGFLTRARDAQSLAAVMRRFLQLSWEERDEMGRASRHKVEMGFSQDIVTSAYLEAISHCTSVS